MERIMQGMLNTGSICFKQKHDDVQLINCCPVFDTGQPFFDSATGIKLWQVADSPADCLLREREQTVLFFVSRTECRLSVAKPKRSAADEKKWKE
jgi:hypothetical protein